MFGQYYDPPFSYSVYPVWRPSVWSTACITASQTSGLVIIHLNGETVLRAEYGAENITENILLMNRARRPQPHHGALADLQVWDRVLSSHQISAWSSCQTEAGQAQGNIISWETVELNISTSLNIANIERGQTCYRDTTQTRKLEWSFCALIN